MVRLCLHLVHGNCRRYQKHFAMDHMKQKSKVCYAQKLNKEAKECYLKKMEINGINPYDHKKLTKVLSQVPQVTLPVCLWSDCIEL